jgi:hypothetical protein
MWMGVSVGEGIAPRLVYIINVPDRNVADHVLDPIDDKPV